MRLLNKKQISSIILKWNNIGEESLEGLESLGKLLEYNGSIILVDLKNNNINADGAYIISKTLERNKSLLSLDLKWNEIGAKGAEMLLEGLEKNTTIKNLDLSCNKIPEQMISEINRILNRNRTTTTNNNNQWQIWKKCQVNKKQNKIKQKQNKNLVYEKQRVFEMKERIENELQEEKQIRDELEQTLLKLRDQVLSKESNIQSQQLEYTNLWNENSHLRNELENVKVDLQNLQVSYSQKIEDMQIQIQMDNKQIQGMERGQIEELEYIKQVHEKNVKELIRDWTSRYQAIDERYIFLKNLNYDIREKINQFKEVILKMRMSHDDQLTNLKYKIIDENQRKQAMPILQLNNTIQSLNEEKNSIQRKNEEILKDIEKKEGQLHKQILNLEKDVAETRQKINENHNQISISNILIEQYKTEHLLKDNEIFYYEQILSETQRNSQFQKDEHKEQVDHLNFLHQNESRLFKDSQEIIHQRIVDLERAIRHQETQNTRVKTEYEKLCVCLQSNIQRTVVDTLNYHQDILRPQYLLNPQYKQ
ncbi:leucine rich repeat protein [Ichthyophthirius multifiliis]|uniref:Leucine rich repeat protein n=1 Tax=Ichthyophthirius multifiliis TaxID=5932 RepID=G0QN68_ICHMU|nr:leucine rich repeat protein [Ichthyophthirius multifiliis]EGR33340.1 leucine rich repeat protein [Ichthyophthirius multifiliis]|eukprot:XP_004037326.1 leucine rich repeat protein [Ichthyophthirius multifiliis]